MPWPLTFHETRPESPRPGDCWYAPGMREGEHADFYRTRILSAQYERDHRATRPPIVVFMPDGGELCLDMAYRTNGIMRPDRAGWTVTGTPPLLTVSPSIVISGYHGWLQGGVLGDDLEGRVYPAR